MRFFVAILILFGLFSCAGTQRLRDKKVSYLEGVRLNFEAGEQALHKKEYEKAIGYFQFVRSKYPFSKYAALSDLKIADTKFAQEKWLDAASAYEVFIRLHPRNSEAVYASYRVGVSYFHAVPSDFFLFPKATSRDQSSTKEALAAFDRYLQQFPNSEFVDDAKAKQNQLYSYLAQHNQHIAAYYEIRGRFAAAITRYIEVDNLYPETEESTASLYFAAEIARTKLKDFDQASEYYHRIITNKPPGPYHEKAEKQLAKLEELSTPRENSDE